jgi:hypothetical protein
MGGSAGVRAEDAGVAEKRGELQQTWLTQRHRDTEKDGDKQSRLNFIFFLQFSLCLRASA